MRIKITTAFDITDTGITGNFREDRLPVVLTTGETLNDFAAWTRRRNQQRNLETVLQLAQMRSQIDDISPITRDNATGLWSFEFTVERSGVYAAGDNDLAFLADDCDQVPVVIGLDETPGCSGVIRVQGSEQNIWFQVVDK